MAKWSETLFKRCHFSIRARYIDASGDHVRWLSESPLHHIHVALSLLRNARALSLVWVALAAADTCAWAQDNSKDSTPGQKIYRHIYNGRNLEAVEEAKLYIKSGTADQQQEALSLAASICIVTYDAECARDVLASSDTLIKSLPASEVKNSTYASSLLVWSYLQTISGNNTATQKAVGSAFPDGVTGSLGNPVTFADLHVLAAQRAMNVGDFGASRDHLDKALGSALSLQYERFDAPRLIVRIAGLMTESYDVERALRLLTAAEPVLRHIPQDSLLYCEYLRLRAGLSATLKNFDGAANDLRTILDKLDKLQTKPWLGTFLKAGTYNDLLGVEVMRGDRESVRRLLEGHPIALAKPTILKRGYFADRNEFMFGLAEEFARLSLGDQSDTGWGDLMLAPPKWTIDAERVHEVWAFGQAAVGLRLLRMGKKAEARDQLLKAGKTRLQYLQDRYRQSQFASPLPFWSDRVLFELSIGAAMSDTPDYDFVVGAYAILNRSLQTSADDALTILAVQDSDEKRRIAQTLHTMEQQRTTWETGQLTNLEKRLWPSGSVNDNSVKQERIDVLSNASEFVTRQRRMREALLNTDGGAGADTVATMAAVKRHLLPDEALVLVIGILGDVVKVCVRADRTRSFVEHVDEATLVKDIQAVRAAVTSTEPASMEADTSFPAAEAVRLHTVLFGGLEDCLRDSPRIYFIAPDGALATVPPAVLLTELPKKLGAGLDLQSAHWMIRDHSFVRTSSISAFVATKSLSKSVRASLDYLGVGDPVLSHRNAVGVSGGEFAARGSLRARGGPLGSLEELPETSEELQQVAALHDSSKARVLVREAASEEAFRLQPLSEFDVIHFATHGLMKEELSGLTEPSLVLTPNPDGDTFNNGLLTSSEIASLPLRARVVILSACNSAQYEVQTIARGIQGLANSFAIAGVPSMVASLWPIESVVTRDLITSLFQVARGSENVAIADALAIAMRRHLDGRTPRPLLHPRFWASLVVIGDGAVKLNASNERVSRDLGPFSDVNVTDGGEILAGATLGADYVMSAFGDWDGKRFASLIQRRSRDGSKLWEAEDHIIGAGSIASSKSLIYAAGYLSRSEGAISIPVLRGVAPDGKIVWTYNPPVDEKGGMVTGLAAASDESVIALVGLGYSQTDGPGYSLIKINPRGIETDRDRLVLEGTDPSVRYGSAYMSAGGAVGLVAVNRDARLRSGANSFSYNSFGLAEACWESDAAEVTFFQTNDLKELKRIRLNRFKVAQALDLGGEWLLVGDVRDSCGLEKHAAVILVRRDYSTLFVWHDNSPFQTSGRGIRKVGTKFDIIGYAERTIAIKERGGTEKKSEPPDGADLIPYFSKMRFGNEAQVSGELFSVRLSERGYEERRDFVGAGLAVVPRGIATIGDQSIIYGTIGSRPLWMMH